MANKVDKDTKPFEAAAQSVQNSGSAKGQTKDETWYGKQGEAQQSS